MEHGRPVSTEPPGVVQSFFIGMWSGVHNALDIAGFIPVVGEVPDGINALIYLAEGDKINAGLSAAAMIPVVGVGATAGKAAKKIAGAVGDVAGQVTKRADDIVDAGKIATDGAKQLNHKIIFHVTLQKLQHEFKHAEDFGIIGNWNKENAAAFEQAILNHLHKETNEVITGTYRGNVSVTHHFNPETKIDVMLDINGNLIGTWKLAPDQIQYLRKRGNLQ